MSSSPVRRRPLPCPPACPFFPLRKRRPPPPLPFFPAAKRAPDRAASIPDRGYYFDFVEFKKTHKTGMTRTTPVIPLIYAHKPKLEDIRAGGAEPRSARHARLNKMVRDW